MTSEQIFAIRNLNCLYDLWASDILDNERIDVATMIDRIETHNREKKKAEFDEHEKPIIINTNYKDIIER